MVKKPNFTLTANDKDVTQDLKENLISISFTDEVNEQADDITIRVTGQFARPSYEDELKLWLGYDTDLDFVGSFIVQTTTRVNNNVLDISATGVNFSNELKEKRDITYEKVSLKDICSQIAKRNDLKLNSDFNDKFVPSQAQTNESDLHFLNRMAKEYNAIFNIKNNTLIFTKKIIDKKKNEALPIYTISANDCNNQTPKIKHSNRTLYKSCKSIWHDTKENIAKEITVGVGKPCLVNKGSFKNEAEARDKASARLERANQGIITGNIEIDGAIIFAGGRLNLTDTLEDDGEYQIKTVQHTFNNSGWIINIQFEK